MPTTPRRASGRPAARRVPPIVRRASRDRHLFLALALVAPVILAHLVSDRTRLGPTLAVSILFLGLQLGLALARPSSTGRYGRLASATSRLAMALIYVAIVDVMTGDAEFRPAAALYIPVTAMAAVIGTPETVRVGVIGLLLYLLPAMADPSTGLATLQRGFVLVATGLVLVLGTRRTVSTLEGALARLRSAMADQRHRSRQLAGLEAVGRVLAAEGPTPAALERVMDLLVDRFGYDYVSIYVRSGRLMRLGAQRGYSSFVTEFDGNRGIMGRIMRTHEPVLLPDARSNPDFIAAVPGLVGEICAPLIEGDELLGVLNVESMVAGELDESDLKAVLLVAERLASAIAIANQRTEIAQRADLFTRLASFSASINATLEQQELFRGIVAAVPLVIPSENTALLVLDRATGRYLIQAIDGGDQAAVGAEVHPGEGVSGRAMRDRTLVVVDELPRSRFPPAVQNMDIGEILACAAVPLLRDDVVIGSLVLLRENDEPFSAAEQEILTIIGHQVALAVNNAFLHADVTESSLRDSLTGLFNRRYLDATLERIGAQRARVPAQDRQPIAGILFDLDHFGHFNKQHGHGIGDSVLRTFATLLAKRFRGGDLVARYGGEEFLAILENATRDEAHQRAETIRREFGAIEFRGANGEPLSATVSAGVAELGAETSELRRLIETADVGLAMAKMGGRDQVVAA